MDTALAEAEGHERQVLEGVGDGMGWDGITAWRVGPQRVRRECASRLERKQEGTPISGGGRLIRDRLRASRG